MNDKTRQHPVLDADIEAALLEAVAAVEPAPDRASAMEERLIVRVRKSGADFLTVHMQDGLWRDVGAGVRVKKLIRNDRLVAHLLQMDAGSEFPAHDHHGDEESIVLQGEVWIGDIFCSAGDFHFAPKTKPHDKLRTDVGCLLYVRSAVEPGGAGHRA